MKFVNRVIITCLLLISVITSAMAATSVLPLTAPLSCLDTYSAIKENGNLLIWGSGFGSDGWHNLYETDETYGDIYIAMEKAIAVAIGQWASFAIDADGVLWGWGSNHYNQLPEKSEAEMLTKIMDDAVSISVGNQHCLAIRADGSLWGWGQNDYGQLLETDHKEPTLLMEGVVAAEAKGYSSYALLADGSLWAWGSDTPANSGNAITTPVKIMDDVYSFSAGFNEVMIISKDFNLWVMGCANQQGGSLFSNYSVPTKIMESVAYCSQSIAVKKDGTLWMWEDDYEVSSGKKLPAKTLSPLLIMDHVICAKRGLGETLILTNTGDLWALKNRYGPGENSYSAPVKIMSDVALPENVLDYDISSNQSPPTIYHKPMPQSEPVPTPSTDAVPAASPTPSITPPIEPTTNTDLVEKPHQYQALIIGISLVLVILVSFLLYKKAVYKKNHR